jgi:hypothetical protein
MAATENYTPPFIPHFTTCAAGWLLALLAMKNSGSMRKKLTKKECKK